MNCKSVQKLLVEQQRRALDSREEAALQEHLKECNECRAVAAALPRLDVLLGEWSVPDPSVDLPLRVMSHLGTEEKSRREIPAPGFAWLQRVFVPIIVAAGLVLGFLLGSQLERLVGPSHAAVAKSAQELEVLSDPSSGSLTEAFEAVTLASTGR